MTFVLVVAAATVLLLFFGSFLAGILIRPQLKRFQLVWSFIQHNRYSPAIWAASFAVGNVTAFFLGYYKEFLDQYATLVFIAACITLSLGIVGNFLLGMLMPHSANQATGESFTSAGSLHLTDKTETHKKSST